MTPTKEHGMSQTLLEMATDLVLAHTLSPGTMPYADLFILQKG